MRINEILHTVTRTLHQPVLYRAETFRTRYPSGTFWSLDLNIAKVYSTKTQRPTPRSIQVYAPRTLHLFDVDVVSNSTVAKRSMQRSYTRWADAIGMSILERKQMYMWDVLWDNQSDFVYPTQQDMDFVVNHMGLQGVYYSWEGSDLVQSIFLAGAIPQDTEYLDHILSDPAHPLYNTVKDFAQ